MKLKQELEQMHSSRDRINNKNRIDCDTSIIDMDISPVCLERKPMMINSSSGRNIVSLERIKNAIKSLESPKNINKKIIFVGNISKYYSKNYIRKLFARFGAIKNVKIYGKRYR